MLDKEVNELKEKAAKQESNNENGSGLPALRGNPMGAPLMLTGPGMMQSPMMTGTSFTPNQQPFGGF